LPDFGVTAIVFLSNVADRPVDQLKTGMPVYVDFEKQNDSVTLPVFRSRGVIG